FVRLGLLVYLRCPYTTLFRSRVRADGVERLLLAQAGDPLLEGVVVALQRGGPAAVAGGAVRSHELVQPVQQRARVGDVAADRGVDLKSTRLNSSHVKTSYAVF